MYGRGKPKHTSPHGSWTVDRRKPTRGPRSQRPRGWAHPGVPPPAKGWHAAGESWETIHTVRTMTNRCQIDRNGGRKTLPWGAGETLRNTGGPNPKSLNTHAVT
jgi:hypothetical protein